MKFSYRLIAGVTLIGGAIFVSMGVSARRDVAGRVVLHADGSVAPSEFTSERRSSRGVYSRRAKRVVAHMDFSRKQTNADMVLPGSQHASDIIPFTGKGVVIGVVDGGIDPHHPAFLNSARTESRIRKYILTESAEESATGFLTANIFSTPEEIAAAPADNTCEGHGTHTASIAGGAWTGNPYYGVAPDAELVLVTMGEYLYDDEIIYGMNAVADYAKTQGRPCTMNFSLGSTLGPHDGTGLFSLAARKAAESGAVIMASSGNDAGKKIAMMHDFSQYKDTLATICWNYYAADPEPVFVEAWSADSKELEIAVVVAFDTDDDIRFVSPFFKVSDMREDGCLVLLDSEDNQLSVVPQLKEFFPKGDIEIEIGRYKPNGRCYAALNAVLPGYVSGKRGRLGFMLRSPQGANVRVYAEGSTFFGSGGKKGFSNGVKTESIYDLSIGKGIISVGSTNTLKTEIVNLSGDTVRVADYNEYGAPDDYTLTSSYGTAFTEDEEVYPQVLAPGTFIVAAYNANSTAPEKFRVAKEIVGGEEQYWGQYTGTSMASPAVAGIVALWLEANPNLTIDDIMEIMRITSDPRDFCNKHGNVVRYGLIDAYSGLKQALRVGVATATADPDYNPRLMMRHLEGNTWECVVAGAEASGMGKLIDMKGVVAELGNFEGREFNVTFPDWKGVYVFTVTTSKGPVSAKIKLN